MPSIHALLVAIDKYPIEQHRLAGCLNDLQAFESYLRHSAKQQFDQLNIKTLKDEMATRQNVIEGFNLFNQAQEGDVCVFYFCGHGSQSPAPKAFWHLAPDHMNESILCWDSRTAGGRDLMDKEMSYLIWKATKDKDIQMVVLMDCCHSGSNTRAPGIKARMADPANEAVPATEYLGYSDYKITTTAEGVEASPPRGQYIHLAAAKNSETAKELRVNGVPRGIFTYSLIEVLEQTAHVLSYGELINRTAIKIRNRVSQQSPQVEASVFNDLKSPFLNGLLSKSTGDLLVSYDQKSGWVVNAGAIQGIQASAETTIQIDGFEERKINVTKVLPNQSLIAGMEGIATDQILNARWVQNKLDRLTVALDDDERLEQIYQLLNDDNPLVQVVDHQEAPRYLLSAADQGFQLKTAGEGGFTFMSTIGYTKDAALFFITKLENIARWSQLLELSNPRTSISSKALKVELFKNMDPGNLEDDTTVKELDWVFPESFEYVGKNGLQQPAFQLKITNTGTRTLWVSALYMGFDFSITNHLLPKQELKSGESVWLADVYDGYPYRTIPLQVEDLFYEAGIRRIRDYIKIIASTDEIDTEGYNQERLFEENEAMEVTRGMGRRNRPQQSDWITREIELEIIRGGEEEEEKEEEDKREPPEQSGAGGNGGGDINNEDGSEPWEEDDNDDDDEPVDAQPHDKVTMENEEPSNPRSVDSTTNDGSPPPSPSVAPAETNNEIPAELGASTSPADAVNCSVYAVPEANLEDELFIQVWLHLPELGDEAASKAKAFDEDAIQRAFQSLSLPLENGDKVTLVLTARGIEFDETTQVVSWNGQIQSAQFIAFIPDDFTKNKVIFTLRVFKEDIPIGHLKFIIDVVKEVIASPPAKKPLGTEARQYKKAFISYASKDRNEVLKRVQMLDKLGIQFFQDLISLNPGERWEQKLYENIDDSDLFLLFWSTAAKESKWVLKELQYAISLKQNEEDHPPIIQPVPIEGPPIVYPPDELGHMHFNDKILYFIMKEETT